MVFSPNSLAQYSFITFHMTIIIHDNNLIFIIANLGSFLSLSHLLVGDVLYNFRVDDLRERLLGFFLHVRCFDVGGSVCNFVQEFQLILLCNIPIKKIFQTCLAHSFMHLVLKYTSKTSELPF